MRAVRFHDYSGVDGIRYEEAPNPVPRKNEVLIRVHAAAVNPFDFYAVSGYVNEYVKFELPAVLGRDVSGVIEQVGADVTAFKVGDAVYGQTDPISHGTFADYTCMEDFRIAAKPDFLTHVEAAALPNVILAAWDGLFSATSGMNLQPGQTVLIHGAAGGIGGVAVQLARWRGSRVIATASSNNLAWLRELEIENAFDYSRPGWEAAVGQVDAVLDTATGELAESLCALIKPGGAYVGLRGPLTPPVVAAQAAKGVRCISANGPNSLGDFAKMAALVEQKIVKPAVRAVYPIAQVQEALKQVMTRNTRGKIVLQIQ